MTANETRGPLARTLLILGRLALAAIFLFAAYAKLKSQAAMRWSGSSIKTSRSFELFLALWLFSGVLLRYASLTTTLLLGAFFAVMVRTYTAGLEINCGC